MFNLILISSKSLKIFTMPECVVTMAESDDPKNFDN